MEYTLTVRNALAHYAVGAPIFFEELVNQIANDQGTDAKAIALGCATALDRMEKRKEIVRFQKGLYYIPKQTPFGPTPIDLQKVIEARFLREDNGFDGGATFLHQIGAITQMPNVRHIISNKAPTRPTRYEELGILVRKPAVPITPRNKYCLQIIDGLSAMDDEPVDVENPYKLILKAMHIRRVEYRQLLANVDHYPKKNAMLNKLAILAREEEDLHETAH